MKEDNSAKELEEIRLMVEDGRQRDVDRGIARIDQRTMQKQRYVSLSQNVSKKQVA